MANIVPGRPVALEGIPPTDGLLAGIVCLTPTLVGSLRDEHAVAHVVRNREDEGLNIRDWILYSISLPRASYFLVVPLEDCRSNIVGPDGAQEESMKQDRRGRAQLLKEWHNPRAQHN